eukprot:590628_1
MLSLKNSTHCPQHGNPVPTYDDSKGVPDVWITTCICTNWPEIIEALDQCCELFSETIQLIIEYAHDILHLKNTFQDDYQVSLTRAEWERKKDDYMGMVFRCKRKKDGIVFVAKRISKALIRKMVNHNQRLRAEVVVERWRAEVDIMRQLKHKYIVNLRTTYETKDALYIVMDECKGGELGDRIDRKKQHRYPEAEAKPIIKMVCEALSYMHDEHHVVYCNLSPYSILFANNSKKSDIKMADFGHSKVVPRLQSLRGFCGIPYCTAPEVITGEYGPASDMWSLGVIAFLMIFGYPPFYVDTQTFQGEQELNEMCKLILKGFDPQVKKGAGPWFPRSLCMRNTLSRNGMDFISRLMTSRVDQRFTAKEALQHPWLKEDDSNLPNMDLFLLQLSNFARAPMFKWVMGILFFQEYEKSMSAHLGEMQKLFSYLDKDGVGKISYANFEEGVAKCSDSKPNSSKLKQIFAELDMEKTGEIDFGNLVMAMVYDYFVSSDARLYKLFHYIIPMNYFDLNGSGHIETVLLKKALLRGGNRDKDEYEDFEVLFQSIDDVDVGNSGTISYDAFLSAVLLPDAFLSVLRSKENLEKEKSLKSEAKNHEQKSNHTKEQEIMNKNHSNHTKELKQSGFTIKSEQKEDEDTDSDFSDHEQYWRLNNNDPYSDL